MEQKREKTQVCNLTLLTLQSLALFMFTYYASFLLAGLAVLYIAYDFDIQATLFFNHIIFQTPDESPLWTTDAIISVMMATPVSSFVLVILSIFIFMLIRQKNSILLYASVWLFLQAFNHTFGLLSENLITQSGLIIVAREMGIKSLALIMTVGVSIFFLIKSGVFSAKMIYAHTQKDCITPKKSKIKFAFFVFILPWLIGSSFILVLSDEITQLRDLILTCFMLILLLPAFFVNIPEAQKTPFKPHAVSVGLTISFTIIFLISIYYFLPKGISYW